MKIQASITGYAGQPRTIVALLDEKSGIVTISKGLNTFRKERIGDDFAFIANYLASSDCRFTDKELSAAIDAYFEYQQSGLLLISETALQYQPDNHIELDGVNESGRKYRIGADMSGGQIGVLAIAWFCQKQQAISGCMGYFDDLPQPIPVGGHTAETVFSQFEGVFTI